MAKICLDLQIQGQPLANSGPREALVRQIFGVEEDTESRVLHKNLSVLKEGLIYITGYSGAGKSCLLREIQRALPQAVSNLPPLNEELAVLNCIDADVAESIEWFSNFGLGEARVLLTKTSNLSVGQRERLRLALLIWNRPSVVIIDEFLASLDRITARVIAYQFQKLIRKLNITCFVATAQTDLKDALYPDQIIQLDFDGVHETHDKLEIGKLPESSEIVIEDGTLDDYEKLKRFHYMDNQIGDCLSANDVVTIRRALFRGKVIGVRVFTKPYPSSFEKMGVFQLVNRCAAVSSRVIVHPAFRGLGVASRLDLEFEKHSDIEVVFTHSVLSRFFPYDLRSGYKKTIHVSEHYTEHHRIFADAMRSLGVSPPEDINKRSYAKNFWSKLPAQDKLKLRKILSELLIDYDLRYFRYVCEILHLTVPEKATEILKQFFLNRLQKIPNELFWTQLSEGLFFPMQGLVKRRTCI